MTTELEQNQKYETPMVGLREAYISYWKNAFCWRGRSTRAELWWPGLVNGVLFIIMFLLMNQNSLLLFIFMGIFQIITFFPGLAVFVRRAHDIGKSAWFALSITYGTSILGQLFGKLAEKIHDSTFYIFTGILMIFLGLLAVFWSFIIAFKPGQKSPNKYGDPR